jgi:DNA-3-methyladenine glycosylase
LSRRLGRPVGPAFFARDTVRVARDLLGLILESRRGDARTSGRIVEVEAYIGAHDPADHGYQERRTARNAALFGPPATAYVFRSYGVHWCFNTVTERAGLPTAVLIRALEPVAGLDTMSRRRGLADRRKLCAGPGRLCQALGIDGTVDGARLDHSSLSILRPSHAGRVAIAVGPRIGISHATDWPLRFAIRGSPWLSRPV